MLQRLYRWFMEVPPLKFLGTSCALLYIYIKDELSPLTVVSGKSMYPTLPSDRFSILTTAPFAVWQDRLQIGDLVVAQNIHGCQMVVKRICGLEGDILTVHPQVGRGPPKKIQVLNRVIATQHERKLVQVPRGHVWLEGDNPLHSYDSRQMGPMPLALVKSRVGYALWPPDKFGSISKVKQRTS